MKYNFYRLSPKSVTIVKNQYDNLNREAMYMIKKKLVWKEQLVSEIIWKPNIWYVNNERYINTSLSILP